MKTKEYRDRLWAKYNLIMGLVNDIPSQSEKRVILHYLWGFKPVEISRELDVTKPYISRILSGKWLKMWGWKTQMFTRQRLILLTHYLADWYKDIQVRFKEKESKIEALREKIRPMGNRLDELEYKQEDLNSEEKPIPVELLTEIHSLKEVLAPLYCDIDHEKKILDIEINTQLEALYQKVITSFQTKVYFHDFDEFEQSQISLHVRQ